MTVFDLCSLLAMDHWQTLIAGILAFVGAVATIWVLLRQAREGKRRIEKAARIRVPHALSPLTSYLNFCFEAWLDKFNQQRFPEPPSHAIEVLMQVAPDIDEKTFEAVSEVVKCSQYFADRAKGFTGTGRPPPSGVRVTLIADIAYLLFLTNRLYAYGRLEAKSIPLRKPSVKELLAALPMVPHDIGEDVRAELQNEIEQAIKRHSNPLNA